MNLVTACSGLTAAPSMNCTRSPCWLLCFKPTSEFNTCHIYSVWMRRQVAGICVADAPVHVTQELWRHTEQKGYYTRLESPAAALLREQSHNCEAIFGPDVVPPAAAFAGVSVSIPRHLAEGLIFDTVELFSGAANWSLAHREAGFKNLTQVST